MRAQPLRSLLAACLCALLNACGFVPPADDQAALEFGAPDRDAPRLPSLPTRQFAAVDEAAVARVLAERSGMPFPVIEGATSPSRYLARARIVVNEI